MFARHVSIHLKPNTTSEFAQTLDKQIIPLLQKQKGFKGEIALAAPDARDVVAISLWDRKEDAEAYNRATYPEVLRALAKVVEGTPQVQNHEVSNSTFRDITVTERAARA